MQKKAIIENEYIVEEFLVEIDFDLNKELKIDWNDFNIPDKVNSGETKFTWAGDSYPIKIDKVLKILNKLKDKHKCKYVEIMYHEDHIGYYFNGLNIHKHVEGSKKYKEYNVVQENEIKRQQQKKIVELENELKQLTGNQ